MNLNPTDHPAGVRLLVQDLPSLDTGPHEVTILEWSSAGNVRLRWNADNRIEWRMKSVARAMPVLEVLAPAPTHPPHPFDETVDAAWRLRGDCRYVSKVGTYEDGTRMLVVVGVGPAAESLARIIDAASSLDPRSTTEKPMKLLDALKEPPSPYPRT